ncbi:hypothetical protein DICPUDRAFT_91672 [Dictyostelium purpureum]|uniref:Pesticidal crystal protein N-terminal domain-containing protein n=1 Tax=Dictyostelium purpureum TaxID=5786 RepID=F0ZFM9_DICPU|nr:uncharacterized protein DICPUDRAFT_91672 [Dictyostelium purpureum]EGC37260.1 hypothetical protein DICPUDRAFT_91672 [Dictyostelium purpureum]|eukprot:XP_003286230.1 hypothetical protein DICPUDRAFT_91672 [Dictyostelium purpureum]
MATTTQNPFDLEKLNENTLKKFKEDPLNTIVPAGFTGDDGEESDFSPVQDPLQIGVASLKPNLDDLETMGVAVIGLIPTVGPLVQGFYQIFRNRTKVQALSKEEVENLLDSKIKALKQEMEQLIDQKLEKSQIEQYKTLSKGAFEGFYNSSLKELSQDLDILKLKLSKKEIEKPEGSFLTGLRGKYDIFRDSIKALLSLLQDIKFVPYVYNQLVDITYLYIFCMQNLINYWYQYGYVSEYARYTPASSSGKATHSYRDKLHINIQKTLKTLQNGLYKIQPGLDNLSKMLEMDPVLYPVPLFKAPVVPSFNGMADVKRLKLSYSRPVVEIDVNMHARPFIYRVDGVNFIGNWSIEDISGCPRMVPKEKDQITDCYGFYLKTDPSILIKLSEPKYVSIRLFTKMESNEFCLDTGFFGFIQKHDFESGSLAPNPIKSGSFEMPLEERFCRSGFSILRKSEGPLSEFDVSFQGGSSDITNFDKLLFLEIVISDN